MLFSSPRFFVFFAAVIVILGLLASPRIKKCALVVTSCLFYAAWDWRCLGVLLASSAIGYACAIKIQLSGTATGRKKWLLLSVSFSLALLAYFRYCDFLIVTANDLLDTLGLAIPRLDILLPVGISFYTFTTIAYSVDVYRGQLQASRSCLDYFTFIAFFPTLIAGPILRGSAFLPQLAKAIGPSKEGLWLGLGIFLQGFTKKVFIADRLASIADPVFADPSQYSTLNIWLGLLAYSLQIYCDFSGYSDMAIGVAKMIGFDLPENFNMPYISTSITDFWRRWHITLSAWFRDYVFLPLAFASARKLGRLNLTPWVETMSAYSFGALFAMLLCGLWHGASWNFAFWGGVHGAALVIHRYWLQSKRRGVRLPAWAGWVVTQLFVTLAWVPFRASSFSSSKLIFAKLFGGGGQGAIWVPEWLFLFVPLILLGHMIGMSIQKPVAKVPWGAITLQVLHRIGWAPETNSLSGTYLQMRKVTIVGSYLVILWMLIVLCFSPTKTSPFVYFRF